ncbi:hypothetical protein [Micromonospora sp. WMMD998]|uniref:hypothetical protein n=1 Tax=Micromonospora sp. WMMD998 TaxID=3016092 RepID=UPI00249A6684|nr:hypothetical protein [Micromonospora sp. WMMD998]WFE41976.1 hypothetical protein O7619_27410 [Micromonospora sp. WMMD998]
MENTWGPRKTEPEPEPCGRSELTFFTIGAVAVTVAVTACVVEYLGGPALGRGLYALLGICAGSGFVSWAVVWAVGRAERRIKCAVLAHLAAVEHRLAGLTSAVQERAGQQGHVYRSTGTQDATVPLMPTVDPAAAAALRRLNMRLLHGGGEHN